MTQQCFTAENMLKTNIVTSENISLPYPLHLSLRSGARPPSAPCKLEFSG